MVNRVQTLRSSAPGVLPQAGTRQPGELWLNFADFALGFIDAAQTAQKILAVRWFVPTASYAVGDFVLQGGNLYRAIAPSAPGTFVAANWSKVGTAADLTAMQAYVDAGDAARLPLVGGTLTGPLILAADPTAALGATTKQYVDTGVAAANANAALRVPLAGGTMTGALILSGPPTQSLQAATKAYVDSGAFLPIAGGTMLGPIVLAADPAAALQPATKQYVDGGRLGDNRLINGDMRIDQRNNGANSTASNVYTVDRWTYAASQVTKGTWQRVGGAPLGFGYSLIFTSSSAYTSVAADYFAFQQPIEADMVVDFAWGTAGAQPVTLSFWVETSQSGTFSGSIRNAAQTRSYPFSFNVPSVGAWTKIVITIPGDTGGSWTLTGNGEALRVCFDLGSGSSNRGPANAWATTTAPGYLGVTGSVSTVATNGAYFVVTGVKLEIGSVATPFNRQSLAKSLADCQRYYQKLGGSGNTADIIITGYAAGAGANNAVSSTIGISAMRATPTATLVGTWGAAVNISATNLFAGLSTLGIQIFPAAAGPVQLYTAGNTSTYISLSAEL